MPPFCLHRSQRNSAHLLNMAALGWNSPSSIPSYPELTPRVPLFPWLPAERGRNCSEKSLVDGSAQRWRMLLLPIPPSNGLWPLIRKRLLRSISLIFTEQVKQLFSGCRNPEELQKSSHIHTSISKIKVKLSKLKDSYYYHCYFGPTSRHSFLCSIEFLKIAYSMLILSFPFSYVLICSFYNWYFLGNMGCW